MYVFKKGRRLRRPLFFNPGALLLAPALFALLPPAAGAADKIKVVTTTADLRSLVEIVGAQRVQVVHLAAPSQDAEAYEPRPQDLRRLRDADMVVKIGLDYDLWMDRLLKNLPNPHLHPGGKGYVDASTGIALLEIRAASFAPQAGHNHGAGNPHYWLDAANAQIVTGGIMEALARLDPAHARHYEGNRAAFLRRLKEKIDAWRAQLARFSGAPVIAYHNSWSYFARRFRLHTIDYIELKPGVPASPAHLAGLVKKMRQAGVKVIIKQAHEPEQIPNMLADKTGAMVVSLAPSVGSVPRAKDYLSLFDYNIDVLAAAFAAAR